MGRGRHPLPLRRATRLKRTGPLLAIGSLAAAGLAGAVSLSLPSPAAAATPGTFTGTANLMGVHRAGAQAELLANGRVLLMGGNTNLHQFSSNEVDTSEADLFDPATSSFSATGSMSIARQDFISAPLPNGQVLVAGGTTTGGGFLATAELYDPAKGTFSPTGPLITARAAATAQLLPDGQVLVFGGSNSSSVLASAELYNPATGTFRPTGSTTSQHLQGASALLADGQVLIAGGFGANGVTSSAEVYDASSGTWSPTASMNVARQDATSSALPDGTVLVAGGSGPASSVSASAELYHPDSGSWTLTGSMSQQRAFATSTLLPDGQVLVAGGIDASGTVTASADLFDPTSSSFAATGTMSTVRNGHTATLLGDGRVLVAGGGTNSSPGTSTAADLYQSPADLVGFHTSHALAVRAEPWFAAATGMPPVALQGQAAALIGDGKVLVAGGATTRGATAAASLYDPAAHSFAPTGPMGTARSGATATLLPDGRVLVAGGATTTAEVFNPATGAFATTGSMHASRSDAVAILLPDGLVLVAGGGSSSAELFNPAAGVFSLTGFLPAALTAASGVLLPDGQVLLAGGAVGGAPTAAAELYDPASGTWSTTSPLGTARENAPMVLLPNGLALVIGGDVPGGGATQTSELFDAANNSWSATGTLGTSRAASAASLLPDGEVLAVGGFGGTAGAPLPLSSAELFNPSTGAWSATGPMTTLQDARYDSSAVALRNGQVLVLGGINNAGPVASVVLYNAVARLALSSEPAQPPTDSPIPISVTAVDDSGATNLSYGGTVAFTSNDPAATLPGPHSFVAADQGSVTVSVTFHTPGSDNFVATDSTFPFVTGVDNPSAQTPPGSKPVTTIAGSDRIATGIAASQTGFATAGSAHAVVLARSDVFADALVGTPLAVAKSGPLLLTGSQSLDARTLGEMQRLLPNGGPVYLLGGTAALSPAIDASLNGAGFTPTRVAGPTRAGTAAAVCDALGDPTTVLEATGLVFADGETAGAAAAHVNGCVLLSDGPTADPATTAFLAAHPPKLRYAVGGPAATSDPQAIALVGADRYATSTAVASTFFHSPAIAAIASGVAFPDGLTGGALTARLGGPLLLTTPTALPSVVQAYLGSVASTLQAADIFGGPAAVSAAVTACVQSAINGAGC